VSAFVLGKVHIDAMLTAALDAGRGGLYWYTESGGGKHVTVENVDELGSMLVRENVASVIHRYDDTALHELPGMRQEILATARTSIYRFERTQGFGTGQMMAAITCYEYQSCEHDGWKTSDAAAFCRYLREELCTRVPGYSGTWEIDDRGTPAVSLFELSRGVRR
jgi:hypothetical protein